MSAIAGRQARTWTDQMRVRHGSTPCKRFRGSLQHILPADDLTAAGRFGGRHTECACYFVFPRWPWRRRLLPRRIRPWTIRLGTRVRASINRRTCRFRPGKPPAFRRWARQS